MGAIVAAFADAGGGFRFQLHRHDRLGRRRLDNGWHGRRFRQIASSVTGSHTYTTAGVYDVKIAMIDQDGSTANVETHRLRQRSERVVRGQCLPGRAPPSGGRCGLELLESADSRRSDAGPGRLRDLTHMLPSSSGHERHRPDLPDLPRRGPLRCRRRRLLDKSNAARDDRPAD